MKHILEKFEEDRTFNQQNPLFSPLNDFYLGDRIDGGFVKKIETNVENVFFLQYTFDNGNGYWYEPESNIIIDEWETPKDYFIHKHIEKCLYDIIVNNSDIKKPDILCNENEITTPSRNPIISLSAVIERDHKFVFVTEIIAYKRHCGYGKQLLKSMYCHCKDLGFRLFLENMVLPFYQSMEKRGATIIEFENMVEITNKTNLD